MIINDCVDNQGLWLLEVSRIRTVSGRVWKNIQIRTKINGAEQERRSHYTGCVNGFKDFQSFVSWHRQQKAYNIGWELDKDLLIRGNKLYSENTCILLPKQLNVLLTNRSNFRGVFPLGVRFDKRSGNFGAACSGGDGKNIWLGTFSTQEKAFYAYKEFKENLCKQLAGKYKDHLENKAYEALINFKVNMED